MITGQPIGLEDKTLRFYVLSGDNCGAGDHNCDDNMRGASCDF